MYSLLILVQVLPFPSHPLGTQKILLDLTIKFIIVGQVLLEYEKPERRHLSLWRRHRKSFIPSGKLLKSKDPADPENPTKNETAAAKTATEEAYMATAFLSGLNRARYGVLLNELHNAFRMVRDEYPKTSIAAYELAINCEGDTKGTGVMPNDSVAFTTNSEEADVHATDGIKLT